MKRLTLRMILFLVLLYSFQGNAKASENVSENCSEAFVGTVTDVLEVKAPFLMVGSKSNQNEKAAIELSEKYQVIFKVDQLDHGPFESEKKINVLKFGLHQFYKGESYKVESNGRRICFSERLSLNMN